MFIIRGRTSDKSAEFKSVEVRGIKHNSQRLTIGTSVPYGILEGITFSAS